MALNWRNPDFGTTTGDITFTSQVTGRRISINTVHALSDGKTPPRREREAATRLVHNGAKGDIVAVLPIPTNGEPLDDSDLEPLMVPVLQEADRPASATDPRDTTPLDQLWYLWDP